MSKGHAISAERIRTIVAESFNDEIEDNAAEVLVEIMDDMLETIVEWCIDVAEAKGVKTLNVDDVRFICEQEWGLSLKDSMRKNRYTVCLGFTVKREEINFLTFETTSTKGLNDKTFGIGLWHLDPRTSWVRIFVDQRQSKICRI